GFFIDPSIPLPMEKARFNPLPKARAPHMQSFGQLSDAVAVLQPRRDPPSAEHLPDCFFRSPELLGDFFHTHVIPGCDRESELGHSPAPPRAWRSALDS